MPQIKPKQSLGQNFLIDENIARKIVREMNIQKEDVLVEVGPGKGALTKFLAGTGKHLVAVEIDGRLIDELTLLFSPNDVTVIHSDFLEISLAALCKEHGSRLRLAGNLPYHLTSSILFKSFEERSSLADLTVMVQKEVARRIVAVPSTKDYGILAVLARFYGTPKILFNVSPGCFFPRPSVESAIVRLAFHKENPFQIDEKFFTLIVKTTFGKRRKTLRNSLQFLPFDEEILARVVAENEALMTRRPEELTVPEFVALAELIWNAGAGASDAWRGLVAETPDVPEDPE